MKKIAEIENGTINSNNSYHLFWAYQETKERKNQYLDFSERIFDEDVDRIMADLKRCNVKTFTASCDLDTIASFTKKGCKVVEMIVINGSHRFNDKFETVVEQRNAIKLSMPR